jgi:protein NrfD
VFSPGSPTHQAHQTYQPHQTLPVILFLFLSHLGVGIILSLAVVSQEAGIKFFRFNASLAAILIAIGFAFRPAEDVGAFAHAALISLAISEAMIVFYWGTIGRVLTKIRPLILGTSCVAGFAALVLQALAASAGKTTADQAMTVASFLSSAALLGGSCTAMILGHWYLVIPSLEVSHLQSITKVHIGSMVVRVVVVGAAVFVALTTWKPGQGPSFHHYIFSVAGIFFWQRILFGLFGPALLSYLTWETAKIRSTQSATGILYVDFFTVVVGEVLAKYLLLSTGVPL